MEVPRRKPNGTVQSGVREGLAAKLAEFKKKKKSNVEPLFKSCDRFEDDQTEHRTECRAF